MKRIDLGRPSLLEFRGPDARRYLNGQLTQDVRLLSGGRNSLPACVTDAKGRLQFRVWLAEVDGALWVEGPVGGAENLEARLTRYLIADDVEVVGLTGKWSLVHFTGEPGGAPEGVVARESWRFGLPGTDWWLPEGAEVLFPEGIGVLEGDGLEALRIANGVPAWGRELAEGMLPPEAGLDATDISYQKGCYIGQEVISRVKYAGKVPRRMMRLRFPAELPADGLKLVDASGAEAGVVTSVSPVVEEDGVRPALGFVKRGVEAVFVKSGDGVAVPAGVTGDH